MIPVYYSFTATSENIFEDITSDGLGRLHLIRKYGVEGGDMYSPSKPILSRLIVNRLENANTIYVAEFVHDDTRLIVSSKKRVREME